jgi:hypothetical protein
MRIVAPIMVAGVAHVADDAFVGHQFLDPVDRHGVVDRLTGIARAVDPHDLAVEVDGVGPPDIPPDIPALSWSTESNPFATVWWS